MVRIQSEKSTEPEDRSVFLTAPIDPSAVDPLLKLKREVELLRGIEDEDEDAELEQAGIDAIDQAQLLLLEADDAQQKRKAQEAREALQAALVSHESGEGFTQRQALESYVQELVARTDEMGSAVRDSNFDELVEKMTAERPPPAPPHPCRSPMLSLQFQSGIASPAANPPP